MAVSGKYGKIDIAKIKEDEPIFILRAQDKLAVYAIELYRALAASHGAPVAVDIQKDINSFRNWQGAKKLPD